MIYIAIIFPVFLSGITLIILLKLFGKNKFDYPLDFGLKFKNKRLFGKNKTIKGPIVMTVFTGLYGLSIIKIFKIEFSPDLSSLVIFYYYSLVGLSYSLGELPNSFIKRQLSIPPGDSSRKRIEKSIFRILDMTDSLIGCGIIYYCLFKHPLKVVLETILLGGFIHLLTDQLMIYLRLKKKVNR